MVLLMMEGFDVLGTAGVAEYSTRFPTVGAPIAGGRFGGGCVNYSGGSAMPFVFPGGGQTSGVCGSACQRTTSDAAGTKIVSLYASGTEVVYVRTKATDISTLEVVNVSTSAVLASVPKPTALLNLWAYIEIGWTVGNGTGKFQLAWNGVEIVNLTGLSLGTVDINELRWTSSTVGSQMTDDVYLLNLTGPAPYNARLGDCRVETLFPNADGASSQWLGSDANSLLNYQLVDEVTVSSTDYVAASATGVRDVYAMTDPSGAGSGDILAVQVQAYMAKSDAGVPIGNLNSVLRAPTGEVTSTTLATAAQIASTYASREGAIATADPTGAAWTAATVTNIQAGVEVV